ncbi:MAG TPA: diguanylate cyclase [Aquihabitans sp.]|nr:diguanylate cyclase [Aquihabitans sp.]
MIRSRALPATVAGALALASAILAVALDQRWLVVLAALFAGASASIVLDWHRRYLAHRATRAELAAEAAKLVRENDAALARAARFEADAIRARAELAEAMSSARATPDPTAPPEPPTEAAVDLAPAVPPRATGGGEHEHVVDEETGLFSQVFFDASLVKRVSAARRGLRPLSVAVADVVVNVGTPQLTPAPAGPVAQIMMSVFREADTLARSDDGLFLVLLEDTPENGAIWTLERLRRRIAEELPGHTLWVGLSCYPAFGFDADQLVSQARGALSSAREWQQDRIEVTTAAPD